MAKPRLKLASSAKKHFSISVSAETAQGLDAQLKPGESRQNALRRLCGLQPLTTFRASLYDFRSLKMGQSKTFGFEYTNPASLSTSIRNFEKVTGLRFRIGGSVDGYTVTRYK